MRQLVSTVTGTWQRHALLLEMIENVREQTYRPLEMVIVSDGQDRLLRELMALDRDQDVPIRFAELGFWASGLFTNSTSAAPFLVAQLLARGEYQITLSDDERFLDPDAITTLVDNLERTDADFAYSQVRCYREPPNPLDMTIGTNPPRHGQITQFLYRRDALDKGMLFRTHVGSGTDWDAVSRTMAARGRWVYVPEVLSSHRVDKLLALGLLAGLFLQGWL